MAEAHRFNPTVLREYDIRGVVGKTLGVADAEAIGRACIALGAGRQRVEDDVDHAVGLSDIVKIGEPVSKGQPMAVIHANSEAALEAALPFVTQAFRVSPDPVVAPDLIGKVIT